MKCTTDKTPPPFTPVSFTITVESEDELKELWCRLGASETAIKEDNMSWPIAADFKGGISEVAWRCVDDVFKDRIGDYS